MSTDTSGRQESQEVNAQNFASALTAPIPRLYVNGFVIAQSLADIAIIAQQNGAPNAVLNLSFTSAKSLSIELARVIEQFETRMNHKILTIQDIEKTAVSDDAK